MTTFCVQWPRFGPYHLARLDATSAYLRERGIRLIGLETASRDDQYAWKQEQGATTFERITLLPGPTFEETAPGRLHEAMTEALDRIQPDAIGIHSYGWPDARAALAWCRRNRRGAVLMFDSNAEDGDRDGWREWIKSRIVRQYDAGLIAGTRQSRYATQLGLPQDVHFLGYDVVDNDFFRARAEAALNDPASRSLPGLDDPTPFFLASNRFLVRKNLPLLLRAYNAYRQQVGASGHQPWRLVMLGDGPLREALERQVAAEQIEGVVFAGFRQIDEIPAYYAHASAFVHPSEVDQWALVVNEAMAAGLPVIVSEGAGCVDDLVDPGRNGFRFGPHDESALVEHLVSMSTTADLEAMAAHSQAIIAEWSLERFASSFYQAAEAARVRGARRGFDPVARALLTGMRMAARSSRAFHSIEV